MTQEGKMPTEVLGKRIQSFIIAVSQVLKGRVEGVRESPEQLLHPNISELRLG